MDADRARSVGLRELRHRTGDVLGRVRRGETIDVTEHGRLIARIVPAGGHAPPTALQRLIDDGRATMATRPGFRPPLRPGDGTERLGEALADLRNDETW